MRRFITSTRPLACAGLALVGAWSFASGPEATRPDDAAVALARLRVAVEAERAGDSAAARRAYQAELGNLASIADWLRLRAAALTRDSLERQALYREIHAPAVLDQVLRTEAVVRERLGDIPGAVAARLALGDMPEVIRLRLGAASPGEARDAVLHNALALLSLSSGSTAARLAAVLVPSRDYLSNPDLLLVARNAVESGAMGPAVEFYRTARDHGARFTDGDRYGLGRALFAQGEYRAAAHELGQVGGINRNGAAALRGLALVRAGESAAGRQVLERLVARAPEDSAAGSAFLLLADLRKDAGDYAGARRLWLRAATAAPASAGAARARFLAAMVLWNMKHYPAAAAEWDSLRVALPRSEEAVAAAYWAGRAWDKAGQSQRATLLWEGIVRGSPLSYYAGLARQRLGQPAVVFTSRFASAAAPADLDSAQERLSLLARADLVPELRREQRWLESRAGDSPERVIATARLLVETGAPWEATQLGWRAWRLTGPDAGSARLIFPLRYQEPLATAAREAGLDPALVAALIRQESVFDSGAVSRAGARGLMQVMPAVGSALARARSVRPWHADSLFDPVRNLALGTVHLAQVIRSHSELARALAAYNAGSSRVARWSRVPGAQDPEAFIEWIPFNETRGYVKSVLRNREMYRALYEWG